MSENETPDQKGNSNPAKGDSFPKEIRLTYDINPIVNLTHAINQQKDAQKETANGTNGIGDRQVKAQEKGNRIAQIGAWVTAVLAVLTIVALVLNARAVNEASRAADAAVKADSIYIATLRWDSTKNAQASVSDSIKFAKQYSIASRTLGAQITSLNASRKQFEIENSPVIQLFAMKFDTLMRDKPMVFEFAIANFGKQPAIILDGAYKMWKTDTFHYRNFDNLVNYSDLDQLYMAGGMNSAITWTSFTPQPLFDILALQSGRAYYFLLGKFKYQNTVTKKTYLYTFDVRFKFFPKYSQASEINKIEVVN